MQDRKNSPPAQDYAIDELMITVLADQFHDGEQTTNGMASFIPVAAFMLARMTHAPELVWLASSGGLEPRPRRIPASTLEAPLWRDSIMYLDQYTDFWNFVLNGRLDRSIHSLFGRLRFVAKENSSRSRPRVSWWEISLFSLRGT